MKVIKGIDSVDPPLDRSVLTIGNFDGVHRGHQQLLAQAGLFSANCGAPVVVLTFDPHPLTVVAPDRAPRQITPPEDKLQLLADAGADITVIARSSPALLGLEAESFVDDIILNRFRPLHIVEGPSFGFGRARRGTVEMLRERTGPSGCEVHLLEPVHLQISDGETLMVSSSLVRRLLLEGKVRRAALCLGRPYVLRGRVVSGYHRGRSLGFPTANVLVDNQIIPGDGVYAAQATLNRVGLQPYPCAVSIGRTPTFDADGRARRQIEAHLLDFDADLYDEEIGISFGRRLRDQQKFDSSQALTRQLKQDVEAVRREVEQTLSDTSEWESIS